MASVLIAKSNHEQKTNKHGGKYVYLKKKNAAGAVIYGAAAEMHQAKIRCQPSYLFISERWGRHFS